jgi:uncharacterized membrane protein
LRIIGGLFAIVAISWLLQARPASADGQEFCNETSFILYSAIAFPDQSSLVSEGWTRLRPGECRTVLPAPVPPGEYFVFAQSSPAHRGGIRRWSGPSTLCVDAGDFSVSALANCENLGLESRGFHIIDGNSPKGRRSVFIETGEYGERAAQAGLQRLLSDNGLKVKSIDGYAGRRTRIAVSRFLKRQKINQRPSDADLIDRLEQSAKQAIKQTGLEVCNQAGGQIWSAYAKRKNNQWETRGWWSLEPGTCVQLISNRLRSRDKYYLYTGLRTPDGEIPLKTASETFCVSEVKFSIVGRHDCEARGYLEASFTKVKVAKDPMTRITVLPEDFGQERTLAFSQ